MVCLTFSKTGVKEPVLISGLTVSEQSSCWLSNTTSTIPLVKTVWPCVIDITAAWVREPSISSVDYGDREE